jgi:ABC-type glycerol-3-phosphate transport system permease component
VALETRVGGAGRTQQAITSAVKYALLIALCLVMMGPVVTAVLGSIRTTGELLASPFGLPKTGIHAENYTDILGSTAFWNSLKNSLVITVGVTLLNITLGSMLAFIFSRVQFRGRTLLFNILLIGLLFPLVVAILPIFIQVRSCRWWRSDCREAWSSCVTFLSTCRENWKTPRISTAARPSAFSATSLSRWRVRRCWRWRPFR